MARPNTNDSQCGGGGTGFVIFIASYSIFEAWGKGYVVHGLLWSGVQRMEE